MEGVFRPKPEELGPVTAGTAAGFGPRPSASGVRACARDLSHAGREGGGGGAEQSGAEETRNIKLVVGILSNALFTLLIDDAERIVSTCVRTD